MLCCTFAVVSSFQHQAEILLAVVISVAFIHSQQRHSIHSCRFKVTVSTVCLHGAIWEEAGAMEPARCTLAFPRWSLCVCLHMLTVTFSPVFFSFNRNRGAQLLAYFCLFSWFWHNSSPPPPIEVPPELPILKLHTQCTFCSWQTSSPQSRPLCFHSGGTMPLDVSFLLTKPLQLFWKGDPAQVSLVDLAFVNCIINNCAYEMPVES